MIIINLNRSLVDTKDSEYKSMTIKFSSKKKETKHKELCKVSRLQQKFSISTFSFNSSPNDLHNMLNQIKNHERELTIKVIVDIHHIFQLNKLLDSITWLHALLLSCPLAFFTSFIYYLLYIFELLLLLPPVQLLLLLLNSLTTLLE